MKDIDAWSRVDKKNPEAIQAFILTGPFEGLVEAARAAIGGAERYQAGVFVDKIARDAARLATQKAAAEEKQRQADAAAEKERQRSQAAAIQANDALARRAAFLALLVAASPAWIVAATAIAVQIEYLLGFASGVSNWGVNLDSDAIQRAALTGIERVVVSILSLVTWNWVVVGVQFGEALYGLAACCLGALSWWVAVLDDEGNADARSGRITGGCAALPILAVVLYVLAALVPAVISVALFVFVGWLLIAFLVIWAIVQGVRAIAKTRNAPYGSLLVLCTCIASVALVHLQDGYTWLNVLNGPR